jgi:hypothetical protein
MRRFCYLSAASVSSCQAILRGLYMRLPFGRVMAEVLIPIATRFEGGSHP